MLDLYILSPSQIPPTVPEVFDEYEAESLLACVKSRLQSQSIAVVAHYYTHPILQQLADETGGCVADSLEMARFGSRIDVETLIVCGVRFMGETAKILDPQKRILMPDLAATCSLDIGCPPDAFSEFCDRYPERIVVVYANTSAAVKARADWMTTSGSAVEIVRFLAEKGEKIIWAPDKYLGQYVQKQTGADMLLWQGACVVHEEFKGEQLVELKKQHPDALVLVHPESPPSVIAEADIVGSTARLIQAAGEETAQKMIVATDSGLFYKMQVAAPDKEFIAAPTAGKGATCVSCARCPWMAMNGLRKLEKMLDGTFRHEIEVAPEIVERARIPIERLLSFTQNPTQLAGDA